MVIAKMSEFHVNGAALSHAISVSLTVNTEMLDVTTIAGRSEPNPRWTAMDAAGHWHAAATRSDRGGRWSGPMRTEVWYPTLVETKEANPEYDPERADADDEYDVPATLWWRSCMVCGARVDPDMINNPGQPEYIAGETRWTFEVEVPVNDNLPHRGLLYTVRGIRRPRADPGLAAVPGREWFGVARWQPTGTRREQGYPRIVVGTFEGVGQLGERVG